MANIETNYKYYEFKPEGGFLAALGNYTKYVGELIKYGSIKDIRRWQYYTRHTAGTVNFKKFTQYTSDNGEVITERQYSHRVTWCNKVPLTKSEVSIRHKLNEQNKKRHSYHNVISCGSVWTCPICQFRILQQRQIEISEALSFITENCGYEFQMLTLTIPHELYQDQKYLIEFITKAWRMLVQSNEFKAFNKKHPFWVKALETRYGKNGLHPHFHLVYGNAILSDLKAVEALLKKWLYITGSGVKGIQAHEKAITNYSKTDYIFESVKEMHKSLDHELTSTTKKGHSIECTQLANVDKGLYKEFVLAIKGAKKIQGSKAFTDLMKTEIKTKTESEILNEAVSDIDDYKFTPDAWNIIRHEYDKKAQIINMLDSELYCEFEALLKQTNLKLITPINTNSNTQTITTNYEHTITGKEPQFNSFKGEGYTAKNVSMRKNSQKNNEGYQGTLWD